MWINANIRWFYVAWGVGLVLQYKGHYCELLHLRWQNVDALLLRYKK